MTDPSRPTHAPGVPSHPAPVTDDTVADNRSSAEFSSRNTTTADATPQLQPHQLPSSTASGTALASRDAQPVGSDTVLPSVKPDDLAGLREKKAKTLEKAGQLLEKQGQSKLLGRALDLLNKVDGAAAKEKDQLVITVSPPPGTETFTVFPPDENLDPEKLADLQKIALKALTGYQTEHVKSDMNPAKLTAEIEECKVELKSIQTSLTKLQVDEPGWEDDFKQLEKKDVSFEVKDEDGHYVLKSMPKSAAKPSAGGGASSEPTKPESAIAGSRSAVPPPPPLPSSPQGQFPKVKQLAPVKVSGAVYHPQPDEGCRFPGVTLLGEAPNNGGYSDIYDSQRQPSGKGNIASVNAGDTQLYVGGGGINRAFGNRVVGAATPTSSGFADYHRQVQELAPDDRGFCVPDLTGGPVVNGVEYTLCKPGVQGRSSVFVHVYTDDSCISGNPENRAMVYIVPPDGRDRTKYPSTEAFLQAIQETAADTMRAVQEYNLRAKAQGMPPLDRLRSCCFSSDGYIMRDEHGQSMVSRAEIAAAIHAGYQQACQEITAAGGRVLVTTIEYENGSSQLNLFSGATSIQEQPVTP